MSYQDRDLGLFDYHLSDPSESAPFGVNIPLRKPLPTKPGFIACIGAAQTFGRFVDKPWGHQLGERLGLESVLLAKGGTGPEYWLDRQPDMIPHLKDASVVIVQVMSARSVTSSFVENPEWVEVTRNMINAKIKDNQIGELQRYIQESKHNYVQHMKRLLDAIPGKKVLFWFSQRTPEWSPEYKSARKLWGEFPQMVDAEMMETLKTHADAYVECISSAGLPANLGVDSKGRHRQNKYYPSQEMHDLAVVSLEHVIRELL